MSRDYIRLALVLFLGLVVGMIIGHVTSTLLFASLGFIVWQQQKLAGLLSWLQNKKHSNAPEVPGHYEEICLEIDRLRFRHKKRKKKLSAYLQQFHQATAALPDATIVLDEEYRIQWANFAAKQFLNIQWPQDQRQRITNLIRSPILEDYLNDNHNEESNNLEITSPSDPDIYLSIRIVPYGKNQRLFVARNVTQMKKLIEIRKDFVANVSHELRTPLTVLRGYSETMQQNKQQCPESWLPVLETMNEQTTRMEAVIDDLLTLSRLEEGPSPKQAEAVLVPEMIAKIHEEAVTLSAEKEHLFQLSAEPGLWLKGSYAELYSAFSNLVFNAVRYTPDGGVINLRWYSDQPCDQSDHQSGDSLGNEEVAHMEVSDNGIGIPPSHLPRLTERFYRVEQSRNRDQGGSGLGLSIVKHILSRHNASLNIKSTYGEGSVFRCDFPKEVIVRRPSEKIDQSA
jgi:two-component system phosphate regulon sensor histidine kinase PhoR